MQEATLIILFIIINNNKLLLANFVIAQISSHECSTSQISHQTSAIQLKSSSKLQRSSESSCRVYSFIPVDNLPSKTPHKYDAFFAPLIEEIENLYLDGKRVFFRSAVSGYSTENSRFNVHVVPLLAIVTEDMLKYTSLVQAVVKRAVGGVRLEVFTFVLSQERLKEV